MLMVNPEMVASPVDSNPTLWVIRDRAISRQCRPLSAMPPIAIIQGMLPK
jgi:hypothetical protein